MIPRIVKQENLPYAVTLNQATFLIASVSGHALGGFLIALITIKWTLVVIIISLIIASLFFWTVNQQQSENKNKDVKVFESMKEGLAYIYKTKEILRTDAGYVRGPFWRCSCDDSGFCKRYSESRFGRFRTFECGF
jgi:hypothetical protein